MCECRIRNAENPAFGLIFLMTSRTFPSFQTARNIWAKKFNSMTFAWPQPFFLSPRLFQAWKRHFPIPWLFMAFHDRHKPCLLLLPTSYIVWNVLSGDSSQYYLKHNLANFNNEIRNQTPEYRFQDFANNWKSRKIRITQVQHSASFFSQF